MKEEPQTTCRVMEVQCKFPKDNINYFLSLLITTKKEMMQYSLGSYYEDLSKEMNPDKLQYHDSNPTMLK